MNNNIQCSIESSTTSMELNSAADGIYLVPELEGLAGLPEIRTTSGVNAGYDGGWTSAQNYDARLIAIRGVIANKDIAMVEAMRRKLASLLGQGRKEQLTLRFTTEAGNAYTINVRTISCEMALQRVLNKQDFLIQLRADDPLIYDDGASGGTEAILRVQQALGGFEINFGLPLAIGGSSDATAVENGAETVYPIIKLYGPLHSPTVVNMTTNQQMQIIADLGYTINWSGWTGVSGERLAIPNELDKEAPLRLWGIDGNATQNGTPTPDAPVPISVVTGENVVNVVGKNLFDYASASDTANTTVSSYRIFEINGLKPSTLYTMSNMTFTAPIPGTYIYFWGIPQYPGTPGALITNGSQYTNTKQYISNSEGKIYLAIFPSDETTWNNTIKYFENAMLVEGTETPAYEPYTAQDYTISLGSIELAKIGNYQDRIYKTDGKWYVEKQITKIVTDGSESGWYAFVLGSSGFTQYWRDFPEAPLISTSEICAISDYFTGGSLNDRYRNGNTVYTTSGGNSIAFNPYIADFPDLASFKSWLSTHPTTVYYALAEPVNEEITNEEVLEGLEAIGDATLYVGANNIYTDTPGALPTLEVDYSTDYDETRDTVVIDSQARTITLNGADIYHLKTEESGFPVLAPGENRMYLTSATTSDTGYAEVKFKQGYLSI